MIFLLMASEATTVSERALAVRTGVWALSFANLEMSIVDFTRYRETHCTFI